MRLTSPAFEHGGPIPKKYTEDGQNISPPLIFEDVPPTARTLAIIVDDPDAPRHDPWVHWVLYNVPAQVQHLPEAIPRHEDLSQPIAAQQGINSWPRHNVGYRGPAPPKGHGTHHYHFRVYALDDNIALSSGLVKDALLRAMEGRILGQAELIGTYARR